MVHDKEKNASEKIRLLTALLAAYGVDVKSIEAIAFEGEAAHLAHLEKGYDAVLNGPCPVACHPTAEFKLNPVTWACDIPCQ